MFPYPENDSSNVTLRSFTKHSPLSSREGEIIEVGPSHMHWHAQTNSGVLDINGRKKENVWEEEASSSPNQESVTNQKGRNGNRQRQQNSIVKGKVSLAHVIGRAEACSQQGGWSRRKAISIAQKLEQENLRLEPKSSLLCWRTSRTRRKLSSIKVRNRKSRAISRLILCGRCISTKSPR
uniref:Uncharacterized protein n=2 Tax=Zea mays TaxID=4577 RepID=A0A804QVV1_MAIZE